MLANLWPLRQTMLEAAKRVEGVHDQVPGKVGAVFGVQDETRVGNTVLTARAYIKSNLIGSEAISSPMQFTGEASISVLSFEKLKPAWLPNAYSVIS